MPPEDSHHFEHIVKPLRGISLTDAERDEMRGNIRRFMVAHPIRDHVPLWERIFGTGFSNSLAIRPAMAGLLIFFVVGTGTSYVAADALPGDFLYPVKINVNEKIASALAVTAEAKASHTADLAIRRLEEAESLAAEGRLTGQTRADIETRFKEHAEAFEQHVAVVAEKDQIEAIAEVQSDLEASLNAHATVLADLSVLIPEVRSELAEIANTVTDQVRTVQSARLATEETIAVKVGKEIKTAATAKKRSVERDLLSVRARPARPAAASSPAADTTNNQEDTAVMMTTSFSARTAATNTPPVSVDPITEAFEQGSVKFEEGQYGEAFKTFQEAARAIKQEQLEDAAHKRLKIDVDIRPDVSVEVEL